MLLSDSPLTEAALSSAISSVHEHCGVFTHTNVAEMLLDLVGWTSSSDLTFDRLLEPACGDGAILVPAVERLVKSARDRGKLHVAALVERIVAFEFEPTTAAKARLTVENVLRRAGLDARQSKDLASHWVRCEDFLLADDLGTFSHIAGNPPYMRWSKVPRELKQLYELRLPAHAARGDLCLPFVCRTAELMSKTGSVAFLCADRWLRCAYAGAAREELSKHVRVAAHFDVNKLSVFAGDRNVGAYAGITLLDRRVGAGSLVTKPSSLENLSKLIEATAQNPTTKRQASVLVGRRSANLGSENTVRLLERMAGASSPLPDVGVEIRCGMALGLVEAFVVDGGAEIEQDRLVPFVRSRDLQPDGTVLTSKHLVNVWSNDGKLINLSHYPLLCAHLQAHKPELEKRVCVVEPTEWYRTIDHLHRDRFLQPKILVAGMAKTSRVAWSAGGEQASNALYVLTSREWPLPMLYALLRAGVLDVFASVLSPKFSGETKRFDGNILRQVRIPRWSDLNDGQKEILATFNTSLGQPNAELIAAVYGLKSSEHLRLLKAVTAHIGDGGNS